MIHAQVDVELRDHERIMGAEPVDLPADQWPMARAAMLGLFTWCLLHGQAKRIGGEGEIPRGAVHCALGGGQERTARHLVSAGLLQISGAVYVVRNYGKKNRTKDEIERSIAETAERKRLSRAKVGHGNVTRDRNVPAGSGSGSSSGSLRSSEGDTGEVAPSGVHIAAPPSGRTSDPPADIPITAAITDACVMAAAPKPTRAHVVAALAHARDRGHTSADWPSYLIRWVCRERQFASRDRYGKPVETGPPEKRARTMSERPSDAQQAAEFADFDEKAGGQ